MRKCLLLCICVAAFSKCDTPLFEKQPVKVIYVTDSDPSYTTVQIKELENRHLVVALLENTPSVAGISAEEIMAAPYSIGKVESGAIRLRLTSGLDYWNGKGSYWVIFFLIDGRADTIDKVYISKTKHSISKATTYLSNNDFMPRIDINVDISGFLPF